MKTIRADGKHYFKDAGFPVAVRQIHGDYKSQHQFDLTEIKHSHNFSELVIVTEGHGIQWVDKHNFPVYAGDIFILQGNKEHYFKERHNLSLFNVMFDMQSLPLPFDQFKKIPGYHALFFLEPMSRKRHRFESKLHLGRIPLSHCEALISQMIDELEKRESGYEASVLGLLLGLITYLSREYSHTETIEGKSLLRIGEIIGKLERNYKKEWKLNSISKEAYMSPNNLLRVFKEATGRSPIDYLIRIRIQKSMELLRDTNMQISEISFETGFKDSNYFTRQFKKIAGVTPREYRKKMQ